MIDIPVALGSFKVALDIAKGMKDLNDATVRYSESIKLMEQILTAQAAQSSLVEQVRDLETEIAQFKKWEADKERYALTDYGSGTFAYALKPDKANGEPAHRICANCYEKNQKSILQFKHITSEKRECLICNNCGKETFLGSPQTRDMGTVRSSGGPDGWMR